VALVSGIRVFADEYDPRSLPSSLAWGKPCNHGHGANDPRGNLRRASGSRTCIACGVLVSAKMAGRDAPDIDADAIIARSRQRLDAPTPKPKPKPKGTGLRSPNSRGKGYVPPDARKDTGIVCSREGCREILTRVAAKEGSPYFCSRVCAGYGGGTKQRGDDPDVSDAELAAVEA
jgi:hypothetical protein